MTQLQVFLNQIKLLFDSHKGKLLLVMVTLGVKAKGCTPLHVESRDLSDVSHECGDVDVHASAHDRVHDGHDGGLGDVHDDDLDDAHDGRDDGHYGRGVGRGDGRDGVLDDGREGALNDGHVYHDDGVNHYQYVRVHANDDDLGGVHGFNGVLLSNVNVQLHLQNGFNADAIFFAFHLLPLTFFLQHLVKTISSKIFSPFPFLELTPLLTTCELLLFS